MATGRNKLEYEVRQGWEQLPEGWSFVEVAGVATDSKDRVYAFNRGAHPMVVFDRDGKFLNAWGEGVFTNAHGIFIGADDGSIVLITLIILFVSLRLTESSYTLSVRKTSQRRLASKRGTLQYNRRLDHSTW